MPKNFQCPTCAAPLVFEGKMLVDCKYCGGRIIAPADLANNEEVAHQRKLDAVNSIINTFLSNAGTDSSVSSYVIDLRSSSKRAQQNLDCAVSELQNGQMENAVGVFTQTFGVESQDAQKIVEAIGHGKGFDASFLQLHPDARRKSDYSRNVKLVIAAIVLLIVLPIAITIFVMIVDNAVN